MNNEKFQANVIFAARLLLSLMFIESCADKILHWDFYLAETAAKNIPFPMLALSSAALVEFLGSVALITGVGIRLGALALAGYTVIVSFFYFDFWNQADPAAIMARKEFLKNLAVAGGLLILCGKANASKHSL
jgi:putative oxidoreductase